MVVVRNVSAEEADKKDDNRETHLLSLAYLGQNLVAVWQTFTLTLKSQSHDNLRTGQSRVKVEGPYVNGDQFTVRFTMDVALKTSTAATSNHVKTEHRAM